MGDVGAMGGRTAGLLRQGREMGEVHLLDVNQRDNGAIPKLILCCTNT